MKSRLHFILHSLINSQNVKDSIGFTEYSYHFVLEEFKPVLERLGECHMITDPASEVDPIYEAAIAKDEVAVFLNFTAPHNVSATVACPAVHVFAWEFNTLPTESWLEDGLQDWRVALRFHKRAITHSEYACHAVKEALGDEFPIVSIPAPIWDRAQVPAEDRDKRLPTKSATVFFYGRLFDTQQIELFVDLESHHLTQRVQQEFTQITYDTGRETSLKFVLKIIARDVMPPILWRAVSRLRAHVLKKNTDNDSPQEEDTDYAAVSSQERSNGLHLEGVVYTSIFNPLDGRKNWRDMISAFIWAHKEHSDATLVLKTPKLDFDDFVRPLTTFLKAFLPFSCRIVVVKAFLDDAQYRSLLEATTYYVNTSFAEGQCLPLMEYLSAGIPAIAPRTTALADYITPNIAFVVASYPEPSTWQHDPRLSYRALRYRVDWLKLVEAYKESYRVAKQEKDRWAEMSQAAVRRMEAHCSRRVAEERLKSFFSKELESFDTDHSVEKQ